LWLSQVARIVADHCLRVFVVLTAAAAGASQRESAWHLAIALYALPAVLLAPVNGALGNSLAKRWVLTGSAAFCLAIVAVFALAGSGWFACLGLVAVGSAVYFPTRYALLAPAARDTNWPPPRVNGIVEMGAVAAIVAGTILGAVLSGYSSPLFHGALGTDPGALPLSGTGIPPAVRAALGLNLLGLLAAIPVAFRSDVRRPESARQAIVGFFRDGRRILHEPETCWPLLAWAAFRGLVAAITGAFIADILRRAAAGESGEPLQAFLAVALWLLGGAATGSVLAGLQGHPRRSLGLVPPAMTGLALMLAWAACHSPPSALVCLVVGVFGGLVNVPLYSAYQASLPADARGNGMAILNMAGNALMMLMGALIAGLAWFRIVTAVGQLWLVTGLTGLGALIAWRGLLREGLEQIMEILLWPIYRVHARGPGVDQCPPHGPILVLANHTAWFDPLWLAKVLPRRTIPMMTSLFFDLPVLHWLMVHVVHAIRVPDCTFRRSAPELSEAIAALDRGECVVIFPEGMLRRHPERLLRQFGQGVWHILNQRPKTPVIVCWIEGGWGSYTSFWRGPPLTNKSPDWWRRITIAVTHPRILTAELLADDRVTRRCLMQACLEARRLLGLPANDSDPQEEKGDTPS
jgi:1-acyl-sn-glycerol-3-phosphate acyltransferase